MRDGARAEGEAGKDVAWSCMVRHFGFTEDMRARVFAEGARMEACHECIAAALARERAAIWTAAAAVHQQFCVSIACRTNKVMCSEYETYRNRSERR